MVFVLVFIIELPEGIIEGTGNMNSYDLWIFVCVWIYFCTLPSLLCKRQFVPASGGGSHFDEKSQ